MLGRILEGLEAAEIDGRLDVGVVAGDAVGRHLGMCAQGVQQAALVESRWIDALGKVTEGLQRLRGLRLQFDDETSGFFGIAFCQGCGQPELDRECHQVLLRAVMDVAFQAPPLGILRGDDALSGFAERAGLTRDLLEAGLQLRRQSNVAEHLASLGGEIREQARLDRGKRLTSALLKCQYTKHLALVPDLDDPISHVRP